MQGETAEPKWSEVSIQNQINTERQRNFQKGMDCHLLSCCHTNKLVGVMLWAAAWPEAVQ